MNDYDIQVGASEKILIDFSSPTAGDWGWPVHQAILANHQRNIRINQFMIFGLAAGAILVAASTYATARRVFR